MEDHEFQKNKDYDKPKIPYPNYSKFYKNWIELSNFSNKSIENKKNHIEKLIIKKNNDNPDFLDLIYQLRTLCLINFYFPGGTEYNNVYNDVHNHPGWNFCNCTQKERKIIFLFRDALRKIKNNPRNFNLFNKADMMFGKYRHERWLLTFKN